MQKWSIIFLAIGVVFLNSCGESSSNSEELELNNNQAGISLPEGFKATLFADELGGGRHICTRDNGDVYMRLSAPKNGHAMVALRDTNQDGQADRIAYFGTSEPGTGIKIYQNYLYFSTNAQIYRQKFQGQELVPSGTPELILTLKDFGQHGAKPIAFDENGNMYVTIGAPSNACQDPDRQPGVKGQNPCPLLDSTGGIWRFSANQSNQVFADGLRYATGIRHAVAIDWNSGNQKLYAVQHGRDQLHEFWPELFTQRQSAELPAEEMFEIEEGDDFGWPYCFYDWQKTEKLLAPEYGGEGDSVGVCGQFKKPIVAFPGHWAPNAIAFYHGTQFPVRYRGGAFIAFHGSWNRAPYPQQGYKVAFVPFSGNEAIGGFDNFAIGFAGEQPDSPAQATYRPCGLTVSADGSLFISDSQKGRIWKVSYL